jgi:hypothetical protein
LGTAVDAGATLADVCGAAVANEIRVWLGGADQIFLRTATIGARRVQALGHRTRQGAVIEFEEPPQVETETLEALYPRIALFTEEVQDLTSVSEVCALNFAVVDMDKVAQEVLRTVEPDIRGRRIEWRLQSLPPTRAATPCCARRSVEGLPCKRLFRQRARVVR